jgi:hypothetical protein
MLFGQYEFMVISVHGKEGKVKECIDRLTEGGRHVVAWLGQVQPLLDSDEARGACIVVAIPCGRHARPSTLAATR